MEETLYHYSSSPIKELADVDPRKGCGAYKPSGLWVSVGEEWKEWWCEGEDFHLNDLSVVSQVWLKPDANILRLKSAANILQFNDQFGSSDRLSQFQRRQYIDWVKVSEQYQGIIIAPYIWSCRLDERCPWYYGWDCASGCIWDAKSAISHVGIVSVAPVNDPDHVAHGLAS